MTKHVTLLCCALVLFSCATPLPPTGGPEDDTPPRITESNPSPRAVNVDRPSIRLTFSEYVNTSSFARSLSISPSTSGTPDLDWDGRSVSIRLPDGFRPNTTYVLTLDNSFSDIRGVSITSPITFAFSTGPTINAGTLGGRVLYAHSGSPAAGIDIFAYALPDSTAPDSLPSRPVYRTQTDADGRFAFDYMTEQFYFVPAVRDQNRNLAPDPQEAYAVPPAPALFADTAAVPIDAPWLLTRVDTTAPAPLRVQSLSASRHTLFLSEPVRFADRDPSSWSLVDSSSGGEVNVSALYMHTGSPQQVQFTTPPLGAGTHLLTAAALVDTSGNALVDQPVSFAPASTPDTLQNRLVAFLPDTATAPTVVLPVGLEPAARFSAPLDPASLADVISLVDTTGTPLPYAALTDDGTTYRFLPEPELSATGTLSLRIDNVALGSADSVSSRSYTRLAASRTGELRGRVSASVQRVTVTVIPTETIVTTPAREVTTDSSGVFLVSGLPEGTYQVDAYGDADENGQWNGGTLIPYAPPEPLARLPGPQRVRARWETTLSDTLLLDSLQRPSTP